MFSNLRGRLVPTKIEKEILTRRRAEQLSAVTAEAAAEHAEQESHGSAEWALCHVTVSIG